MKSPSIIHYLLSAFFSGIWLISCNQTPAYNSFDDYPVYDGTDLGLIYTPHTSSFRIWSPAASEVRLMLYESSNGGAIYRMEKLHRSEKGTWTVKIDEDLDRKFYTFQVKINDVWLQETPGIWAISLAPGNKRAAVVDMKETHPEGWNMDKSPDFENFTDAIIYETEMRDSFSGSEIKALAEMGITHVHLHIKNRLPLNKKSSGTYFSMDYNMPDGPYSPDGSGTAERIRKFKQIIQAFHRSGIRVIIDMPVSLLVSGGAFDPDQMIPGYFFRRNANKTSLTSPGYPEEIASERAMVRKFITESVLYWVREYHVDGFFLDHTGLMDIQALNEIRTALDRTDSSILVYGDGDATDSSLYSEDNRATAANSAKFDGISLLNPYFGNIIFNRQTSGGFVFGTDSLAVPSVTACIAGGVSLRQTADKEIVSVDFSPVRNPYQRINYLSLCNGPGLKDMIKLHKPESATEEELIKFNKFAQTIVFVSQGIPMLRAGDEFYSGNEAEAVNVRDSIAGKELYTYYKGLIRMRKTHPAFRMSSGEMVRDYLSFPETQTANVVGFMLNGNVNGDPWKNILVVCNGNRMSVPVSIPQKEWTLVVNDGQIDLSGISTINDSIFTIAPSSVSIMYER